MLRLHRCMGLRPRFFSTKASSTPMASPPITYISGEEMTRYTMQLVLDKWFEPYVDMSNWEKFDLSCKNRDITKDTVLNDAVNSGKRIGSIFKEPTVTPSAVQQKLMGLSTPLSSPNGAMRKGWNGITISRDTIHIKGMQLGYKKPVFFDRHAVGGEYGASFLNVGPGTIKTIFEPTDKTQAPREMDLRILTDKDNAVVLYHNPLDNVTDLAQTFFQRCLDAKVVPYVVTKKTVFKWQEGFWLKMKAVFDKDFHQKFLDAGLLEKTNGELQHLISDAATMQIIRWTEGGFGMAAHNYDGDMLTDEIAQVHRSPGFITSNLVGKNDDGSLIKEFEASHGTVADMDEARLRGEETSLNPLGMVEALFGALKHSANLHGGGYDDIVNYTDKLRTLMHTAMTNGYGTRDLCGPSGLTTEGFIDYIAKQAKSDIDISESGIVREPYIRKKVDHDAMRAMFNELDVTKSGLIDYEEFTAGLQRLGVQPRKFVFGNHDTDK